MSTPARIIFPNMDGHRTPVERPDGMIVEWSTGAVVMEDKTDARCLALRIKKGKESVLVFLPAEPAKKMAAFIAKEFP